MFITLVGQLSWQRLRRSTVDLYSKKRKTRSLSHSFGHLGVTCELHLWLVGKPVSTLYSSQLNFFRYLLRLRRYERKSVEVGVFQRGWVTLSADFRVKGASPTNHCWCQKTRVIAVSCGIKIFAVRCLVLSQYTHLTDGQTDRRTDRRTDGQNCDSNTVRALHYMQSHGKTPDCNCVLMYQKVVQVQTTYLWHCCIFGSRKMFKRGLRYISK